MMKSPDATLVLVVSSNAILTREFETSIQGEADFLAISCPFSPTRIFDDINATRPNIILVDAAFDQQENLVLIDQITSRFPGLSVIPILPESLITQTEKVILAGARAFIISPVSPSSLISTLRRIREIQSRTVKAETVVVAPTPLKKSSRNMVVFSPKGGAGCSTVAVNLAISLHQQLKEPVLLMDGKSILGHLTLMLNLRTGNSITDLLAHASQLDTALVKQVVVEHVSGISVLPSPTSIQDGQKIQPVELFKVLQVLNSLYPTIVVDGGNHLDETLVTYMDTANYVLLVVNPNLASIRDARQFLDLCQHLSYSKEKIQVIVNQFGRKMDVKLNEIEKVLRMKIVGSIPVDEDAALNSLNEGIPIIQLKNGHPISKAISSIAKSMINLASLSTINPETRPRNPTDLLKKSSYLG
jgi:pilus assembly protein CpaE